MTENHTKLLKLITVSLLLLTGAIQAMSLIPQLPLTGAWKERFEDVAKLNAYAKTKPIELSNAKIVNKNIDGAVLIGGEFKNNDWTKVSVKKANLTNVVFREGILEDVDFSDSTLTNVVFEDVKLLGVAFFYATLNNVRFVRCTFNGVGINQTKNSRIEVIDSKAISTTFSRGQLVAVFRNTQLSDGVQLTSLVPPSSLTFEKSELEEVNLSRSILKELVLDSIKSKESGFVGGSVDSVIIKGESISFGFSEMKVGQLTLQNVSDVGLAFDDTIVNSMTLSDCHSMRSLALYRAEVGDLKFTRCSLQNFRPRKAKIGTLTIKEADITNSRFDDMNVKSMTLDTVTLSGELDFTNAHVGELKTNNVTKQPGLKLITTGSNVRF